MEIEKGAKIEKIITWFLFLFFFISQAYLLATSLSKEIKPVFRQWAIIEQGPWKLDWQVNSSENKPRINHRGEEALSLSAKKSRIYFSDIAGEASWGLHEFSFSDNEDIIYNSYIGENYALEQINEIGEDGVRLKFFFSPFSEKDEFMDLKLDIVFTAPSKKIFYLEEKNLILWAPKDYLPEKLILPELRMKLVIEPNEVFIEQVGLGESKLVISYYRDKINQRVLLAEFLIFD